MNAAMSLVRGLLVLQSAAVVPRVPTAGLGPVAVQPTGVQNGRLIGAVAVPMLLPLVPK